MRAAWIPILTLLLVGGCMYPRGYRFGAYPYNQDPSVHQQLPPGKILVQDVRTGRLILIDDPNAPRAATEQPEFQPRDDAHVPAPVQPPAAVRVPRPPVPALPTPGFPSRPQIRKPEIGISVGVWATNIAGTASGHEDWGPDEADLEKDLGLEDGTGVSLDFTLRFYRGPRFRLGIRTIDGEGVVPADLAVYPMIMPPPAPGVEIPTELSVFILDLAFSPVYRQARWGSLCLETGLRYAKSTLSIYDGENRFAEGVMFSLGGEADVDLYKEMLRGDVSLDVGFGPDSAFLEFNTGVSLRPTPHFWLRLGYRMLIMGLVDRAEEWDERALGLVSGGPGIELGLEF